MKNSKIILRRFKVALVYDKVNTWGGAERVLLALHEIFPKAPLFTSVYDKKKADWAKVFCKIIPSFLQKFPGAKFNNQWYTPLMPIVFESHCFDDYDIVISVTSGEAKGILVKPSTLHLCYCLTPIRYLWNDAGYKSYNFKLLNKAVHSVKLPFLIYLRIWDQIASSRPDYFYAISKTVQKRIRKYYRRDSEILYPPVNTKFFKPQEYKNVQSDDQYFLVVSRLTGYKKIDLAIKACHELKLPLKIAGNGPELEKLKSLATNTIKILGGVSDEDLLDLYQNCIALIMPQEEDFGIVALEAQACGKPVIAYGKGGAKDTIIENKTGIFFEKQSIKSLIVGLRKFNTMIFNPENCRQQAEKFSINKFKDNVEEWILKKSEEYLP